MIENAELVMQMLEMYQMYKQQVPIELEEYLRYVAETGNTLFQWTLVKPFIREKILNVIAEFAEQSALPDIPPYPNVDPFNYEAMKTVLLERFDTFNGPPFTIQRLCELLSCPRKEYNRVDKFMRAVEKNILVVSTCELRPKREEAVVNGIPDDRWENGKESDINMDMVDKSSVITDANVLNGNETVMSLLNELESMKTPETKLDELKTEHKDYVSVQQVEDEVKTELVTEEPKQDTQVLISDIPQIQITESIGVVEKVDTDVSHESVVNPSVEEQNQNCEIQPTEVSEQIAENSVKEDIPSDMNLENVEPKIIEEPIVESNDFEHSESIPADSDRVEGSIIHQTPDSDNKVEQDIVHVTTLQPEVVLEKSNDVESMDIQVEDVSKSMESEVSCDDVQQECTETKLTGVENDKQQDGESTVDVPAMDTVYTEMDVEPQKVETDVTLQNTVSVNEEIETTKPDTIHEEPQGQAENKLTESE